MADLMLKLVMLRLLEEYHIRIPEGTTGDSGAKANGAEQRFTVNQDGEVEFGRL